MVFPEKPFSAALASAKIARNSSLPTGGSKGEGGMGSKGEGEAIHHGLPRRMESFRATILLDKGGVGCASDSSDWAIWAGRWP